MDKQKLIQAGIDYTEGLERFSGNVRVYEKYLRRLPDITLIDEMNAALAEKDAEKAFEVCHKMKAFIGNLSIPELYKEICTVTEILRMKDMKNPELMAGMEKIRQLYKKITFVIGEEMERE